MTNSPRLVATDLDGTFLRSDGTVSERTARVWNALSDSGIETVLVTARPPRWLHHLEHVVGPRGVALCGNGAFVYEVASRRLLDQHVFDRDVLAGIITDLRAAVPGIAFATESPTGHHADGAWPDLDGELASGVGLIKAWHRLWEDPVGKLLALAPRLAFEEFHDIVEEVVGGRGHLAYSGAHGLAEINPRGVTKASALADWCARLDIAPADVWAFGDMPNDLPMLTWAGRGWAVANSHPDVLAAADGTVPANDDDGVAVALEPLLGE